MYIYFSKSINFSDSYGLSVPEITSKSNIFNYFHYLFCITRCEKPSFLCLQQKCDKNGSNLKKNVNIN